MFGKKLLKGSGTSEVGVTAPKAKPKSPRDALTDKIAELAPGQEITFRLPPIYGSELIVVEANKDYPVKGHRFAVASADLVDGKPGQNRKHIWESDKPKPIADWIIIRNGEHIV